MATLNSSSPDNLLLDSCKEGMDMIDLRSFPSDVIRSEFLYNPLEKVLLTVISPVLAIFGLIGNSIFLFIVAKLPEMQTFTNVVLVNIAVCDIIFILTLLYNTVGVYVYAPDTANLIASDPYDSSVGCLIVFGLIYIAHFTSIWLIALVSLERYLGICKPLQHRYLVTKSRIRNLIISAWIIGSLFSVIAVPRNGKIVKLCILWPDDAEFVDMPSVIGDCDEVHPFFKNIPLVVESVPFFAAAIFNLIIYVLIIKTLHSRLDNTSLNDPKAKDGYSDKQMRERIMRNQVARLLIITGSVFNICFLPYYILSLNKALRRLTDQKVGFSMEGMELIILISRQLLTVNAIANPVIYSLSSPRYRKAFKSVFKCSVVRENRSSSSGIAISSSNSNIDMSTSVKHR